MRRGMRHTYPAAKGSGVGSMQYYPIAVKISEESVVVVGGGRVAERKVMTLLDAGAKVKVVSPDLTVNLEKRYKAGRIRWLKRRVRKNDLSGVSLIIAATNDASVNQQVNRWARQGKIDVNVADNTRLSTFVSPALLRMAGVLIAVYTDGRNPTLSRDLKNFLQENWDEFLSYRDRLPKG